MAHHVASKLQTYPKGIACAGALLAEAKVAELPQCIRLNQDCADVCEITGRVLSRQTGKNVSLNRDLLEACQAACRSYAEECEKHADMHEHCKVCADACRRCEQACAELLAAIG